MTISNDVNNDKWHNMRMRQNFFNQLITPKILNQALRLVRKRRKKAPDSDGIWGLSLHWESRERDRLIAELRSERYQCEPVRQVVTGTSTVEVYSARDAVVATALFLVLRHILTHQSQWACRHLKGGGGCGPFRCQRVFCLDFTQTSDRTIKQTHP